MKRTICIRLETTKDQSEQLLQLQKAYHSACNQIIPDVMTNRCWNRVALHHLVYTKIRQTSPLGSQMVCHAISNVLVETSSTLTGMPVKISAGLPWGYPEQHAL